MSNFEMGWEDVKEGSGGNMDFLKLQTGINQVRIVSMPAMINVHWEKSLDGSTKKVICLGSGCPICKAGKAPQSRYQVKVIDRADSMVKILEGGTTIFNAIKAYAMDPDYGDPTKYDLKLKKEGSGRETKYTVVAAPRKSDFTPDEIEAIDESKSLEEINKTKTIEEIMEMGLEVLADSISDFDSFNDNDPSTVSDDDWENL